MIVDTIPHLERYLGLHPNLDTAIRYIRNADLGTLPVGRNEIDGDQVFVNVVRTNSIASQDREYEYHKHYIDLHLDLSGTEKIAISLDAPKGLGNFDEESDGGLCSVDDPGQCFPLGKERFAIAFPWEPHLPLIAADQPEPIHKCIFKVWVK